jgi:type II secretory pathway component PulF
VRQYLRFDAARSFAATLGMLLEADTALPEAIRLAVATVESPQLRRRLEGVVERVAAGDGFGECLREAGALPPSVSWRLWSAYYRDALTTELDEVVRASTAHLQLLELKIVTSARVAAGFGVALTLAPIVVTICALYMPMFNLISQIG